MCRPITPPSPALPPINIVRGVLPRGKWLPLPSRGSPGSSSAPPSLKIIPGDDRAWEMASPPITWLPLPSRGFPSHHVAPLAHPGASLSQNRPGSRGSPPIPGTPSLKIARDHVAPLAHTGASPHQYPPSPAPLPHKIVPADNRAWETLAPSVGLQGPYRALLSAANPARGDGIAISSLG